MICPHIKYCNEKVRKEHFEEYCLNSPYECPYYDEIKLPEKKAQRMDGNSRK